MFGLELDCAHKFLLGECVRVGTSEAGLNQRLRVIARSVSRLGSWARLYGIDGAMRSSPGNQQGGPEGLIDLQRGTNDVHGNRLIKFSPG